MDDLAVSRGDVYPHEYYVSEYYQIPSYSNEKSPSGGGHGVHGARSANGGQAMPRAVGERLTPHTTTGLGIRHTHVPARRLVREQLEQPAGAQTGGDERILALTAQPDGKPVIKITLDVETIVLIFLFIVCLINHIQISMLRDMLTRGGSGASGSTLARS